MFTAISYLETKFGTVRSSEIENVIEENLGINGRDLFLALESEREVDEFISDFI
jgi:hypothetical protein